MPVDARADAPPTRRAWRLAFSTHSTTRRYPHNLSILSASSASLPPMPPRQWSGETEMPQISPVRLASTSASQARAAASSTLAGRIVTSGRISSAQDP
jgi:hypothetical protein